MHTRIVGHWIIKANLFSLFIITFLPSAIPDRVFVAADVIITSFPVLLLIVIGVLLAGQPFPAHNVS